jgi:PAS domain S-box-containing protein
MLAQKGIIMLDERKTKGQLITELSELRQRLIGSDQEQKKLKLSMAELKRAENIMHARLRLLKFAESHSLEEFTQATLDESEALTGSTIGFYHLVEADQRTLSLQTWSTNTLQHMCTAEGKGRHYDVAEAGVWVDCVHQRGSVIHNNYDALPYRKGMPSGHAPVVRELVVPIFRENKIVAIIGVGNKPSDYDEYDVEAVSLLGDLSWDIAERKWAEEVLRQSEDNFRTLYNRTPVMLHSIDPEGKIISVSDNWLETMGYARDEVLGRHISDFMTAQSRREALAVNLPRFFQTGWVRDLEYQFVKKSGEIMDILLSAIMENDADNAMVRSMGVVVDISVRKKAEAALLKYEFIVNTANDYMTLINRNYIYEAANAVFCKAHGKTREEVVGTSLANIWGEDRFKNYIKGDLDRCFTGQTVESIDWFEFGKMGRRCYHVFYAPYFNEDGTVAYAAVVNHDITARKRDEEVLRESESRAKAMLQAIPDLMFRLDSQSVFLDYKADISDLYVQSEPTLIGKSNRDITPPEFADLIDRQIRTTLETRTLQTFEYQLPIPGRGVRDYEARMVDSGAHEVTVIVRDVTERKRVELERLQFSKLESLGILAGGIAHDFNNILTVILGNIGLAALDDKIGPRVKDRLAQAEAACVRAQALSQQLLIFGKGGAPLKKLFSVAKILTETTVFACVGSPEKCETAFPENLWSIEADPGQIGQVFQNLTINAIQAMPTGGTIKVWAENLTVGTGSGLPLSPGRYIKISLQDQGTGIPAEHLPRIFDPYFTTKQKGSGLGLASAYAIINKHHGHIAVESKPGVGTTFIIYLPAVEGQVIPQPEEDTELLIGKGKILVMDDEEMVREFLGATLAHLGYEAEFARDGGEAIEMFVKAQESGQAFAAVILDLTVPGGMGGKEAMAKLLEIDPQIKVVVSSGYSDDPIMTDCQKYGFSGVIAKPYRISELGKILNQVIMKKA